MTTDNDMRTQALRAGFRVVGKDSSRIVSLPFEAIKYLTDQEIGARVYLLFDVKPREAESDFAEEISECAEGLNYHPLPDERGRIDAGEQILRRVAKEYGPQAAADLMDSLDDLVDLSVQIREKQQ